MSGWVGGCGFTDRADRAERESGAIPTGRGWLSVQIYSGATRQWYDFPVVPPGEVSRDRVSADPVG
jgi:hypothetical protein